MLNIVWLLPGGVDADTQCRWGQAGSEPDGQTPHICKIQIQIRSQTNTNTKSDKYKYKARQTDSSSMQNTEIQLKYTKLDLS